MTVFGNFTLGSDPELMLKRSGQLVSAIPIIKGTKLEPISLRDGMAQHDNVNAEFGIKPAENENEWVDRHLSVLSQLDTMIGNDVKLFVAASANFPESELDCEEAKQFACDPDFNAYTCEMNFIDDDAGEKTLRSCGGHIHVGLDELTEDIDLQINAVKAMDIFLGIPSLLLDKDPTSHRRRELYGKAGAHRPKPYGIEYRSLGNFWISHPSLTRLMWRLTRDALEALGNKHLAGINEKAVRTTIDKALTNKAERAMKSLVIPLLKRDTRELLIQALEMKHYCIYEAWGI